jgi:hypothetical protein
VPHQHSTQALPVGVVQPGRSSAVTAGSAGSRARVRGDGSQIVPDKKRTSGGMMPKSNIQKTGLIAVLLGGALSWQGAGLAESTAPAATEVSAEVDTSGLLDDATLDAMTAPIALYPDTLLGQVLVATTYPLDVLKADRFLTTNAKMTDTERAAAVNDQDWPDSVKSLAAGFPELISRMAEHSDWTETMGEALIAQTDDVLVSIQRLRAQAQVNGYLEDNAAMKVETDPETANITIASANPNVVYVPEYTNTVYYQPAPATPYYVYDNNTNYWGDALVTGAVIWGTAVIIDNIFDDNWGNGWDNGYWHGGGYGGNGNGNSIDWNGDVNIDNSINIGNGNGNGIGNGNRPQIGTGDTTIAGNNVANIDRTKIGDIDRTKIGDIDRTKIDSSSLGDRAQVGGLNQDQLDRARDANFNPSATDRDAARAKIAAKEASGKAVSTLPAATGMAGDRAKGYTPSTPTKLDGKQAGAKPAAKPAAAKPSKAAASAKPAANVSKPKAPSKPPSKPKASAKAPAYEPQGGSRANAAASRGKSSRGGR